MLFNSVTATLILSLTAIAHAAPLSLSPSRPGVPSRANNLPKFTGVKTMQNVHAAQNRSPSPRPKMNSWQTHDDGWSTVGDSGNFGPAQGIPVTRQAGNMMGNAGKSALNRPAPKMNMHGSQKVAPNGGSKAPVPVEDIDFSQQQVRKMDRLRDGATDSRSKKFNQDIGDVWRSTLNKQLSGDSN